MTAYQPVQYPRKRRIWPFVVGAALLSFCLIGVIAAIAGAAADPSAGPGGPAATHATGAAKKPAGKPGRATVGEGVWSVPDEVKPGTYTTTADDHCYWARLSDFEGNGPDSINANGNLDPGAHGRITVTKADKGLELRGECVWTATK